MDTKNINEEFLKENELLLNTLNKVINEYETFVKTTLAETESLSTELDKALEFVEFMGNLKIRTKDLGVQKVKDLARFLYNHKEVKK